MWYRKTNAVSTVTSQQNCTKVSNSQIKCLWDEYGQLKGNTFRVVCNRINVVHSSKYIGEYDGHGTVTWTSSGYIWTRTGRSDVNNTIKGTI